MHSKVAEDNNAPESKDSNNARDEERPQRRIVDAMVLQLPQDADQARVVIEEFLKRRAVVPYVTEMLQDRVRQADAAIVNNLRDY